MPFQKYEPLKQLPSDGASDSQLAGSDTFPHSRKKLSTERAWNVIYILFALLGISITSNIALFAKLRTGLGCNDVSSLSMMMSTQKTLKRHIANVGLHSWLRVEYFGKERK